MRPSITVDERGVLLHVLDEAGEGVAVKLDAETIKSLGMQLAAAKAALLTTEGKRLIGKTLTGLFWDLAGVKGETHGTSDADERRKKDP